MKKAIFRVVIILSALAVGLPLMAEETGQINYQARLLDSYGRRLNTTVDLSFKIYDAATDGNLLWSETQTGVVVQDGVYSVVLGSQTAIPASVFAGNDVYLELGINDETMSPRQQITASAYSLVARTIMGSNIYENQTSGYLGIGTTNPAVKLDVSGTIQATGIKIPTGATAGYVLASDGDGVGTWQSVSIVVTEHDPIHTNWVKTVYAPATNSIWGAIGTEAATRAAADTTLQNNIDTEAATRAADITAASNALNANKLNLSGGIMTGPLTNNVLFFGNGAGLTNVPASGVILTGYVQRAGDTMSGALMISNNLTVALTNAAGATNYISLGGMAISNWNQVAGGDLTNDLALLVGATNALNSSVTNASYQVTNDLYNATNALNTSVTNVSYQVTNDLYNATNALNTSGTNVSYQVTNNLYNATNALNMRVTAMDAATTGTVAVLQTGKVDRAGDTMTGTLTNLTNVVVMGKVGIGTNSMDRPLTVYQSGSYAEIANFESAGGNVAILMKDLGGSVYNWRFGSQSSVNNGFEITPSTALGGTSFSTPALVVAGATRHVGIGINAPAELLHVRGNAIIETNLTVTGNVGIATAAGSYALNVNGEINIAANVNFRMGTEAFLYYNSAQQYAIIGNNGIWGAKSIRFDFGEGASRVVFATNGNVGIAITNPTELLHVNGNAIIETNLTVNGTISGNGGGLTNSLWNNAAVIKTGGGSIAYSNVYFLNSAGNWASACATSSATAGGLLGMALGGTIATDGLLVNGQCTNAWGFNPGQIIYLATNSPSGATGQITTNRPTGTNHIVRIVGYAITNTIIYFNPDRTYLEILGE